MSDPRTYEQHVVDLSVYCPDTYGQNVVIDQDNRNYLPRRPSIPRGASQAGSLAMGSWEHPLSYDASSAVLV